MAWPQAQEYNEAIQNPRLCFQDPELKQGSVKTNAMGLPMAISGGFASVYQVATPKGKWAVRCFLREVPDSQRRYAEISRTLNALQLPYTAPFEFQQGGIRVGGRALPIVKMEWMSGDLLSDYVARNVSSPALLSRLADRWVDLVSDLRSRKIAHGDLQHGNILVVNHELKLIDYDGMFVPSFQGMRANEVGHPNFQHPRRRETDFGLHVDNFSAWVIYASLRILASSPELYDLSRGLGRDECLIFSREDFADPDGSPIFSQILSHPDKLVVRLGEQIATLLGKATDDIPHLDPAPYGGNTSFAVTSPSTWWREHLAPPVPAAQPRAREPATAREAFGEQTPARRELLGCALGSGLALAAAQYGLLGYTAYPVLQTLIAAGTALRLRHHYGRCPAIIARDRHRGELRGKAEEASEIRQRIEEELDAIAATEHEEKVLATQLQATLSTLTDRQGSDIRRIFTEHAVARSDLLKRRQALSLEEDRDLKNATSSFESEVRDLKNQLERFTAMKRQTAVDQVRGAAMNNLLSLHLVTNAMLPGVDERYKAGLTKAGVITAADVTLGRIYAAVGFDQARASALMAWRKGLEGHYDSRLPTQLSGSDHQLLMQGINADRAGLEGQLNFVQKKLMEARERVRRNQGVRRMQLAVVEQQINASAQTKIAGINSLAAAQIADRKSEHEQARRKLQREIANIRVVINRLEADERRLKQWHRDIGDPRTRDFNRLTFARYLGSLFRPLGSG